MYSVAYLTTPGGIAYVASNIYYSAWFTLFSCVYTLNDWSKEKDILSIEEITGVSYTLKGWWIHFLAACVVFGSSIELHVMLGDGDDFEDTSFGIALGLVSMTLSMFYIMMHYDFFTTCHLQEGGWLELSSAVFLIVCWCIGLSILTRDGTYKKKRMRAGANLFEILRQSLLLNSSTRCHSLHLLPT
jgi:hypothetical protein